jgi:peptidoglycan/LPS O-acetylase OafA/YrhL
MAYLYVFNAENLEKLFQHSLASSLLSISGLIMVGLFGFLPLQNPQSFVYQQSGDFYLFYLAFNRFFFIVGVALLIFKLLYAPGRLRFLINWLGNGFFKIVSNSIYPIYLFHFPFVLLAFIIVYWTVDKEAVVSANLLQLVLLVVTSALLATGFSWLAHRFVEAPAQTFIRNRFLKPVLKKD